MIGQLPIRTCVGCGQRDEQRVLVRFVASPEGLRLDPARRAAGRGAYLHPEASCWATFVRRRGPVRSLRLAPGRTERERVVAELAAAADSRAAR